MKSYTIFAVIVVLALFRPLSAGEAGYVFVPSGSDFSVVLNDMGYRIIGHASQAEREFNDAVRMAASGSRIANIGDDPAGKAVAEKMQAVINEISQRSVNDRDLGSYLEYVDGIIGGIIDRVQRIRQLSIKASGGIMGELDREIIQTEIDMIIDSIADSAAYAEFNRKKVALPLTPQALGLAHVDVVNSPGTAVGLCDTALDELIVLRSRQGIRSRMLSMRIKGRSYHFLHMTSAYSTLADANLAEVSTDLSLSRIRMKSAYGTLYRITGQ
ncbi:MAG: flagellin [Spirochaetota bacterium]